MHKPYDVASSSRLHVVRGHRCPVRREAGRFALLHNSIDIRRVCLSSAARHTNPEGQRFDGLHKHGYDQETGEARRCYLGSLQGEFVTSENEVRLHHHQVVHAAGRRARKRPGPRRLTPTIVNSPPSK